ncbi:MAG TPA: hypothetical protein VF857_05985, partial [Spirochaetota bacterium]
LTNVIPDDTTLIIRDMRDSDREDIFALKKTAPVVVIDDCGDGRLLADCAIDLLPNLIHPPFAPTFDAAPFLFGYNFTRAITMLDDQSFEKDIDLVVYTGVAPSPEYQSFITRLVPESWRILIADGTECALCSEGKKTGEIASYAESLLRSKILLSHFGISLFEGKLCGCALASVNPTAYHSALADLVRDSMGVVNFGVFGKVHAGDIKKGLKEMTLPPQKVDVSAVRSRIDAHAALFLERITPLITR